MEIRGGDFSMALQIILLIILGLWLQLEPVVHVEGFQPIYPRHLAHIHNGKAKQIQPGKSNSL